jgi:predicted HAD superfamily phosphohydrolase
MDHKYIKNRKDFFVDNVERDVASPLPSGEELYNMVSEYDDIVFGFQSGKQKFSSFGLTHN